MDVYLPQNRDSNTATVVLIHGGAWIIGSKNQWQKEIINALLQQGYAVACINYQYACGNYQAQVQDINRALHYLNEHATPWNTARNRFALAGASAGGHLSLLYSHAYDTARAVKAAVSLSGPTDLTDTLFHRYAKNYCIGFVFKSFLGHTYRHNPEVYKQASPLFNTGNVPSLFIHGATDNLVPLSQSLHMYDSLSSKGIATRKVILDKTGHLINGKNKANLPVIINEIENWLRSYL
jgi:acetyl esterase/lipase